MRAATQGFNTHTARAAEQIEKRCVLDPVTDDVKNILFNAIHDRARAIARHELKPTTFAKPAMTLIPDIESKGKRRKHRN